MDIMKLHCKKALFAPLHRVHESVHFPALLSSPDIIFQYLYIQWVKNVILVLF